MTIVVRRTAGLAAAAAVLGCATQQQMLARKQAMAMQTATSRGQFELGCPQASGVLLSQEMTQPTLQGPWVGGVERAEYTIGVEGCGQRKTYVVICPEGGESCFAADPGGGGHVLETR